MTCRTFPRRWKTSHDDELRRRGGGDHRAGRAIRDRNGRHSRRGHHRLPQRAAEPARDRGDDARPRRRRLPRLRGRALDVHSVRRSGRRVGRRAGRALRHRQGRSRRHRHAQLSGVGRRLRRHHLARRHLRVAQRVVDRRRARLRPRGLWCAGAHRRPRAHRPQRGHPRTARYRRDRGARLRADRRRPLGRRGRTWARRCPTCTSTPTTTPPSSTRRARPAARRARCRRIAASSRRCWVRLPVGRRSAAQPEGAARRRSTHVHPRRAAVPRHRLRARDAVVPRRAA